jgi:hypothetical protein
LEIKIAGMDIKIKGGDFVRGTDGKMTQTAIVKLTREDEEKKEETKPLTGEAKNVEVNT